LIRRTTDAYFRRVNPAIVVFYTASGVLGDESNQVSHIITST
jgi:hypothetical protein